MAWLEQSGVQFDNTTYEELIGTAEIAEVCKLPKRKNGRGVIQAANTMRWQYNAVGQFSVGGVESWSSMECDTRGWLVWCCLW